MSRKDPKAHSHAIHSKVMASEIESNTTTKLIDEIFKNRHNPEYTKDLLSAVKCQLNSKKRSSKIHKKVSSPALDSGRSSAQSMKSLLSPKPKTFINANGKLTSPNDSDSSRDSGVSSLKRRSIATQSSPKYSDYPRTDLQRKRVRFDNHYTSSSQLSPHSNFLSSSTTTTETKYIEQGTSEPSTVINPVHMQDVGSKLNFKENPLMQLNIQPNNPSDCNVSDDEFLNNLLSTEPLSVKNLEHQSSVAMEASVATNSFFSSPYSVNSTAVNSNVGPMGDFNSSMTTSDTLKEEPVSKITYSDVMHDLSLSDDDIDLTDKASMSGVDQLIQNQQIRTDSISTADFTNDSLHQDNDPITVSKFDVPSSTTKNCTFLMAGFSRNASRSLSNQPVTRLLDNETKDNQETRSSLNSSPFLQTFQEVSPVKDNKASIFDIVDFTPKCDTNVKNSEPVKELSSPLPTDIKNHVDSSSNTSLSNSKNSAFTSESGSDKSSSQQLKPKVSNVHKTTDDIFNMMCSRSKRGRRPVNSFQRYSEGESPIKENYNVRLRNSEDLKICEDNLPVQEQSYKRPIPLSNLKVKLTKIDHITTFNSHISNHPVKEASKQNASIDSNDSNKTELDYISQISIKKEIAQEKTNDECSTSANDNSVTDDTPFKSDRCEISEVTIGESNELPSPSNSTSSSNTQGKKESELTNCNSLPYEVQNSVIEEKLTQAMESLNNCTPSNILISAKDLNESTQEKPMVDEIDSIAAHTSSESTSTDKTNFDLEESNSPNHNTVTTKKRRPARITRSCSKKEVGTSNASDLSGPNDVSVQLLPVCDVEKLKITQRKRQTRRKFSQGSLKSPKCGVKRKMVISEDEALLSLKKIREEHKKSASETESVDYQRAIDEEYQTECKMDSSPTPGDSKVVLPPDCETQKTFLEPIQMPVKHNKLQTGQPKNTVTDDIATRNTIPNETELTLHSNSLICKPSSNRKLVEGFDFVLPKGYAIVKIDSLTSGFVNDITVKVRPTSKKHKDNLANTNIPCVSSNQSSIHPNQSATMPLNHPNQSATLPLNHPNQSATLPLNHPNQSATLPLNQPNQAATLPLNHPNQAATLPMNHPNQAATLPLNHPNQAATLPLNHPNQAATLPLNQPNQAATLPMNHPNQAATFPVNQPVQRCNQSHCCCMGPPINPCNHSTNYTNPSVFYQYPPPPMYYPGHYNQFHPPQPYFNQSMNPYHIPSSGPYNVNNNFSNGCHNYSQIPNTSSSTPQNPIVSNHSSNQSTLPFQTVLPRSNVQFVNDISRFNTIPNQTTNVDIAQSQISNVTVPMQTDVNPAVGPNGNSVPSSQETIVQQNDHSASSSSDVSFENQLIESRSTLVTSTPLVANRIVSSEEENDAGILSINIGPDDDVKILPP